jgi:hypothetical protein
MKSASGKKEVSRFGLITVLIIIVIGTWHRSHGAPVP